MAPLTLCSLEPRDLWSAGMMNSAVIQAVPNDSSFGQLYGMQKINAPKAWDISTGSRSVVIADIDSGVDYSHPDLYKNIWLNQSEVPQAVKDLVGGTATFASLNDKFLSDPITFASWDTDSNGQIDGKDALALWSDGVDGADGVGSNGYVDDLIGWNFVNSSNNPFDDNGHGTHTAGTIGAMGNNSLGVAGVNWNVQIMPLKFIAGDNTGSIDWAASALRYAVDNGAPVSNNSWIYYGGTTNDVVYQAIDYARTHNHLVIAAAGNDNFNNDKSAFRTYPASFALSNVISVAATDSKDAKANFSNYGSTSVDLGAPGVNILSTLPGGGYGNGSGTSMAAPHVTGTVGLILASRPDLASSPNTIKSILLNSVDKLKALSGKVLTGGRLNAFAALSSAQTASIDSTGSDAEQPGSGSGGKPGKPKASSLNVADGDSLIHTRTFSSSDSLYSWTIETTNDENSIEDDREEDAAPTRQIDDESTSLPIEHSIFSLRDPESSLISSPDGLISISFELFE